MISKMNKLSISKDNESELNSKLKLLKKEASISQFSTVSPGQISENIWITSLASTHIILGDINNEPLNQSNNEYLILLATYCFTNSMTILSHYFKLSKRWTCIYQFFINLCKQTATFETIPSDLSDNLPSFALI